MTSDSSRSVGGERFIQSVMKLQDQIKTGKLKKDILDKKNKRKKKYHSSMSGIMTEKIKNV